MMELNVLQHLTTQLGQGGSFKIHKNASLNDPKCQKRVFGHFLEFGLLNRPDVAYCDSTKRFSTFGSIKEVLSFVRL